jgi:hypothetical protein
MKTGRILLLAASLAVSLAARAGDNPPQVDDFGHHVAATPATPADDASLQAPADAHNVMRVWHDTSGREVSATFRGIENGQVFLQTANGVVASVPLERLTPEDRAIAEQLKPEGLGIPTDPYLPSFAQKIDTIVEAGLKAKGVEPNPLASDEQFCRRVYLDLVGRIPTREETMDFLADTTSSKRAKVIDKLINSDGFNARMFSYFADMLRMADTAQKAKFFQYEEWFKEQLATNQPYNKIVFEMMTASGKMLENGAAGYLLRDKGMRLDNLSVTLSTFLGANVACAQCHDHPFADWTQRQFYQMASFFGTTETYDRSIQRMAYQKSSLSQQEMRSARKIYQVNALEVYDTGRNEVELPDDYRYKDGKAGDHVAPKFVTWSPKTDVRLLAAPDAATRSKMTRAAETLYSNAEAILKVKKGENTRLTFAKWMTAPENPRFAMTIANRLWKLVFGVAVKEPVVDLDDPSDCNNPMLLGHLANEMVRLKFDLRAYMRLLCNTQTYQREACTKQIVAGEPYYFPGPTLRRMTAEQAWDSCVTLAIGDKVDNYKLKRAKAYADVFDLKGKITDSQIREKLEQMKGGMAKFGGNKPGKGGKGPMKKMKDTEDDDDGEVNHTKPEVLGGQVLARASELPQPVEDQHFLRLFGQSDRQIQDTGSDEGSIPQVLMLMNGQTQSVLRNPKSLVLATSMKQSTPEKQIESLYYSFFTRHPSDQELKDATSALKSGMTVADMTWVLFNSREFVFVQ